MNRSGPLIGAGVVLVLLFVATPIGLIALAAALVVAVILFVTDRSGERPCPRCGEGVKNGVLDCPHCGFDFRTVGASPPSNVPTTTVKGWYDAPDDSGRLRFWDGAKWTSLYWDQNDGPPPINPEAKAAR